MSLECRKQPVEIPLRGTTLTAIVDASRAESLLEYRWAATPERRDARTRYAFRVEQREGKRAIVLMHRQIIRAPKGVEVDHRNGNGLDNRRDNLRLATRNQNAVNQPAPRDSLLGLKGIRDLGDGRFSAEITRNGETRRLGIFNSLREAALAYNVAAFRADLGFARPNPLEPEDGTNWNAVASFWGLNGDQAKILEGMIGRGMSQAEIQEAYGFPARTVRRFLSRIKRQVQARMEERTAYPREYPDVRGCLTSRWG